MELELQKVIPIDFLRHAYPRYLFIQLGRGSLPSLYHTKPSATEEPFVHYLVDAPVHHSQLAMT